MVKELDIITLPPPAGTCLGPYEILAAIGAGGMGEVYRPYVTQLNRAAANKIPPPRLHQGWRGGLRRFELGEISWPHPLHFRTILIYPEAALGERCLGLNDLGKMGENPHPHCATGHSIQRPFGRDDPYLKDDAQCHGWRYTETRILLQRFAIKRNFGGSRYDYAIQGRTKWAIGRLGSAMEDSSGKFLTRVKT